MSLADAAAALKPLVDSPSTSLLAIDFDGTLAPIVDDPADARPLPGVTDLLVDLAERYADVLIISGRPASFLQQVLPGEVSIVGLYGLEGIDHGVRWEHPNGGVWREVMIDIAEGARARGPEGMRTELKDLSITFHYRGVPQLAAEVRAYATAQAERAGLLVSEARQAVELHPPIDADKGTVVESRIGDCAAVMVVGDDVGDLKAFDAVDRLERHQIYGVRVAVVTDEAPLELERRADVVLSGPDQVRDLLQLLTG